MRTFLQTLVVASAALAADPFLEAPDTGLETYLLANDWARGTQPLLKDMRGIPDFEFAARNHLDDQKYSFYRTAAAGEWSYRNNLEIWSKVKFRPRHLTDVTKVNETLATSILGYNFSAPIFIAPAARGGYAHERGELNFAEATGEEDILYCAALYASKTIEEIASAKSSSTLNGPQVLFQQIYTNGNLSVTWDIIRRAEESGAKAIVWTIDAPATSTRHRAARYDTTNSNAATSALTWDIYEQMKNHTSLPIIPKGISTVEDALAAVERGAPAIYISNHGGRQVDHSPSPLEIAYEIRRNAPEVFRRVEVLADSGVRYGTDVIKLLALGVKAVGLGRPFMFANTYGVEGVRKAIRILKAEIAADAAQLGIHDIQNIPASLWIAP
ncbi:hypothetical protein DL766_007820 [Monosporascus sp. MC13-8B]|uniref:FMN hydroxy acid dehydrogenase domain-containing protein n=1 Tax=Monosporascus cannonballus TaxID=155416 RepID=A0ABY0GSL7_9PEZI|nr:hypothetical protein DL763_011278 [Monosporascus cannonballus]RYO76227.1 hypothetical protein DL762_009840 [Monosporascus cannonballus]RYP21971.1 hypothetical protein DL766_007820 [Monosporascus sp. MC13-8B]